MINMIFIEMFIKITLQKDTGLWIYLSTKLINTQYTPMYLGIVKK